MNLVGRAVGFFLGILALSGLVAICAAAFVRNRGRAHRAASEAAAARWARQHGGDPEYQGGLGVKRQEPLHLAVVYGSGAEQRLERA